MRQSRFKIFLFFWFIICVSYICFNHTDVLDMYLIKNIPKFNGGAIIQLDWKQVDGVSEIFYVYATAYYDNRGFDDIIRIVAFTKSYTKQRIYCHLFDSEFQFFLSVPAQTRTTRYPLHDNPQSTATVVCKLNDLAEKPVYVSVSWQRFPVTNSASDSSSLIPITNTHLEKSEEKFEFAACVQPTYKYDKTFDLIQWMEFQQLMGVEHFTFYNISFGYKTSCILKSYPSEKVTVLPWTPPLKTGPDNQVTAQIAQSNECVLRYWGIAKYIVMVDFDEYIIPNYTIAQNYTTLLKSLGDVAAIIRAPVAQFQFRNGLFGVGFPQYCGNKNKRVCSLEKNLKMENLYLYKNIVRLRTFPKKDIRSKFITVPKYVIEPGIHSVYETLDGAQEIYVNESVAYVHHYRDCYWSSNCSSLPNETLVDEMARYYAESLFKRFIKKYQSVKDSC